MLVIFGIASLIYLWKKNKEHRPFIYLVLIWFIVFVVLQIKSNISLKPRFFMPIAVIPFIFWGAIVKIIEDFGIKILTIIAYLSFFVILLMNFNGIKIWFNYLETQDISVVNRNIFIKQDDGKTFGQIKKSAEFMAEQGREAGKMVCFYASDDYERSYEYTFDVYFSDITYDRISKSIEDKEGCIYFSVATAREDAKRISNRYVDYFEFGESHEFGTIAVWEIYPKENFLNYEKEEDESRNDYQEEVPEEVGVDEIKESSTVEFTAEKKKTSEETRESFVETCFW